MYIIQNGIFAVTVMSWISMRLVNGSPHCATIKIENLDATNDILQIQDGSEVNIQFSLINNSCSLNDTIKIEILKRNRNDEYEIPQCNIIQKGNDCIKRDGKNNVSCTCLPQTGMYLFKKNFEMSDNTTWVWSTGGQWTKDVKLTLQITSRQTTRSLQNENDSNNLPWVMIILGMVSTLSVCNSVMIGAFLLRRLRRSGRVEINHDTSQLLLNEHPRNEEDGVYNIARPISGDSFATRWGDYSMHSSYLQPDAPKRIFSRQLTMLSDSVYENVQCEYDF